MDLRAMVDGGLWISAGGPGSGRRPSGKIQVGDKVHMTVFDPFGRTTVVHGIVIPTDTRELKVQTHEGTFPLHSKWKKSPGE